MSGAGWFLLGVGSGIALIALLAPSPNACCTMLAHAARDKIASSLSDNAAVQSAIAGGLDVTGLTNALPGILNVFGVEKN